MTEAQQNLTLQTQQVQIGEWEYASKLEDKFFNQPKLVEIVNKAEQIIEIRDLEVVEEFHVVNIQVIKVKEIYVDFNCNEVYNSSPVEVKGFNGNQQAYRPQLMVIGLPIGLSWILMLFCAFGRELPQPKGTYNGFGRKQSRGHCLYDRGKHILYCPTMEILDFGQTKS